MLGRKDYTQDELDNGRTRIQEQVRSYRTMAKAVVKSGDDGAERALARFEETFFVNLLLTLDRLYVHRLRVTTGKDGNPLNEVELMVDSLLNNDGVFRVTNKSIKWVPEDSVSGLSEGDRIELDEESFEKLAGAFFEDLERKFV
jgi:hypothetical protein